MELGVNAIHPTRSGLSAQGCGTVEGALTALERITRAGENAYITRGLFPAGTIKGTGGRGTAEDVCALPFFSVDLDVDGPGHKSSNDPPLEVAQRAIEALSKGALPPSLTLITGGGFLLVWIPQDLLELSTPKEQETAKDWGRLFEKAVRLALFDATSSTAKNGKRVPGQRFNVDDTADLVRLTRVPGTRNYKLPYQEADRQEIGSEEHPAKNGKKPAPRVRVWEAGRNDWTYSVPAAVPRYSEEQIEAYLCGVQNGWDALDLELPPESPARAGGAFGTRGAGVSAPLEERFQLEAPLDLNLPPMPASVGDEIKAALEWTPCVGRDRWVNVGHFLWRIGRAYGQETPDWGADVWAAWTEQAMPAEYHPDKERDCWKTWQGFRSGESESSKEGKRIARGCLKSLRAEARGGMKNAAPLEPKPAGLHTAAELKEAHQLVEQGVSEWVNGNSSLALTGDPGLGKTGAALRALPLILTSDGAVIMSAHTLAQGLELLGRLKQETAELHLYQGRTSHKDHPKMAGQLRELGCSVWKCDNTRRVLEMAELGKSPCTGCDLRKACGSTPGKWRFERSSWEKKTKKATRGKTRGRPQIMVCTHGSQELLLAEKATQGLRVIRDDDVRSVGICGVAAEAKIPLAALEANQAGAQDAATTKAKALPLVKRWRAWREWVQGPEYQQARAKLLGLQGQLEAGPGAMEAAAAFVCQAQVLELWPSGGWNREQLEGWVFTELEASRLRAFLADLEERRCFPDGLAARVTADGCKALRALPEKDQEPLLDWFENARELLGEDGLLGFAQARGDLAQRTLTLGWSWEALESTGDPLRSIARHLQRWAGQVLTTKQRLPVVVRPPAKKQDKDKEPGALSIWETQPATVERIRAGKVLMMSVAPLPAPVLEGLGVKSYRVELESPDLHKLVVRHTYSNGKLERFNLGKGTSSGGRAAMRKVAAAVLRKEEPWELAGHTIRRAGVVCQKADRDIIKEEGTDTSQVLTYGSGHAGTNGLEGVDLLLVANYREPPHVARLAAEVARRACGIQGSPGLGALTSERARQLQVQAWSVDGWNDPDPLGMAPKDTLEAEMLAYSQAQTVANAVGRSRTPAKGQKRLVVLFAGRHSAGVRPSGMIDLADLHSAAGLEAPSTEDPQLAGLVEGTQTRQREGSAPLVLDVVRLLHRELGRVPSQEEVRRFLGREAPGESCLRAHRRAAEESLGLRGDALDDALKGVLELLNEDRDLDELRSATLAALTDAELRIWKGKSTRRHDMRLVFEALEVGDLPHGKRATQRKRFETILQAVGRVLIGTRGTQEGGAQNAGVVVGIYKNDPGVPGAPLERQQELPPPPKRPAPWVAPRVPDEWRSMDAPWPAGYAPASQGFDSTIGRGYLELLHPGRGDLPRIWQVDATQEVLESLPPMTPLQDPWAYVWAGTPR